MPSRFIVKPATLGLIALTALGIWACDRPVQARSIARVETARATPLVIDSILSSGEALRRFQSDMLRVHTLAESARSRDDLVGRFISALESADTLTLRNLLVNRAEYGYLYFPSSSYSRKPYELPPEIAWILSEQNSLKGLTRVTRRLGGESLGFRGYDCGTLVIEGENKFWRACVVSYFDPTSKLPVTRRLFGAIMERDGRYKFLSYANDF